MKKLLLLLAILTVWSCTPQARTFGASGGTASPIIPASWTVAAWFIDPANSSGTASDSNNCTSSATPCLTWHQVNDVRWGCQGSPAACPRFQQSTAIEFMSSQADNTDPVYFYPAAERGSTIQIFGPLGAAQQIATGVLSNVTAKNRATPQLLLAQSGATAIHQLVVNTTHASRAWTYLLSSGSIYKMTQPEAPITVPGGCGAEVDTWTNGDSVTVYAPVQVNISSTNYIQNDFNGGFNNNQIYLYNISVNDFGASGINSQLTGSIASESLVVRGFGVGGPFDAVTTSNCNSFFVNAVNAFSTRGGNISFSAGALLGVSTLSNVALSGDVISAGTSSLSGTIRGGASSSTGVYIESAKILSLTGSVSGVSTIWWGPGTLNVSGSGRLQYTANAATNLLVTTLQLNGVSTGHSINTAANVDTPCGGISLTAANLDTAVSATCATTGFGGLAFNPGGASITTGAL
jgi:hypothetical protein